MEKRDIVQMIEDYYEILVLCDQLRLILIATTLAPTGNYMSSSDLEKLTIFNKFMRKMPYCIDIYPSLLSDGGIVNFEYFANDEKDITGFEKPFSLVFWSKKGKDRVLKTIKDKVAEFAAKR
jgi:hypothetical protein